MKKHLLLILSVGLCVSAVSQDLYKAIPGAVSDIQTTTIDNEVIGFHPTAPAKPLVSANRAVTKTKIGSSYNALTLLVSASNCLTADQTLNTIMFTHRINQNWAAPNVNSGFIQSTFSTNGGSTWDSLLQLEQVAPNLCRYPSGAIFNPTGNSTPGNAYGVVTGPITDGTTPSGWKGNYFASTRLDKTLNDVKVRLNATGGVVKQHFARIALQSTDNKVIVTGGLYGGEPDASTTALQQYRGATLNIGTLSGTAFNWVVDSIKPNFKVKPTGTYNYALNQTLTAWSQNGLIGYVVFIGVDNAATGNNLTYQPLVWKTTNGGTTWAQLPLFDFGSLPAINARLRPTWDGTATKAFYSQRSGMDAIVDAAGNLHIVNIILSGSSTNADTLDYIYNQVNSDGVVSYIFDTHTTTGGSWDATYIDSLKCATATTNSPYSNTTGTKYGIDARIQISASYDRTHLFYLWLDSDPTLIPNENVQPDIYARGLNTTTGLLTQSTRFTFDETNYYLYASNVALTSGTTYKIPATVSASRDGSGNVDLTFDHYYVSGIQFDASDFVVGVNEISNDNNLSISQNYPNPFSKLTSVDVTLKDAAAVTIEVSNMIGQNVMVQNSEKLAMGTHTFTIDGSRLPAGVYFYTVKTGTSSITQKMIIQ